MPEMDAGVRLVGGLILREARVPIGAERGATIRSRVRPEAGADLPQMGREIDDETQRRILDIVLVPWLVRLKPLAVVVVGQFAKKARVAGVK